MRVISYLGLLFLLGFAPLESIGFYEERDPLPKEIFKPSANKKTACFITINSVDEKNVFTKYLNPQDWDLVELASPDLTGSKVNWFNNACQSNIQCDVTVISGHFAGSFFGESGYRLSLQELESHSCAQDCSGILRNPKEVYLFGCNTLLSKNNDRRSPEEYYQILIQDGFREETARLVVEDHYGAFGQDNKGKMQRAFAGVPYLYGFSPTAPLGKYIKGYLDQYFKKIGNYTAYIESLDAKKNAKTKPNLLLSKELKKTNFTQCAGLDATDSEHELHLQLCQLFSSQLSLSTRTQIAYDLLSSDKVLAVLPSIQNFVRTYQKTFNKEARVEFERLKNHPTAKNALLESIQKLKVLSTQIDWIGFAYLMSWIPKEEMMKIFMNLIKEAFKNSSIQADLGNFICTFPLKEMKTVDFSAIVAFIEPYHFTSETYSLAMGCLGLNRYEPFKTKILQYYREGLNWSDSSVKNFSLLYKDLNPVLSPTEKDIEIAARLQKACTIKPGRPSESYCGQALANLGAKNPTLTSWLANYYRQALPQVQMSIIDAYKNIDVPHQEEIDLAILESLRNPKQYYWYVIENYFSRKTVRTDLLKAQVVDYLLNPIAVRKSDEMIYTLRETTLSKEEWTRLNRFYLQRKSPLMRSKVYLGWLSVALNSDASDQELAQIIRLFAGIRMESQIEQDHFEELLKRTQMKSLLLAQKETKAQLCQIMQATKDAKFTDENNVVIPNLIKVGSCP